MLQAALVPPARPVEDVQTVTAAQVSSIPGSSVGTSVPESAALEQARELNIDLWMTFVALSVGSVLGIWAGRTVRR